MIEQGDEEIFPRLNEFRDCLKPGGVFKGVELIEGWIATKNDDFPSIQKCGKIIDDAVSLYISGDDKIKGHRKNMFMDSFHKKNYTVSKVIDRVNADCGRCPFLSS